MPITPSYVALLESGELTARVDALYKMLGACTICPHNCGNDRLRNNVARCHSGLLPIVSSSIKHLGEEPAIGGMHGVGNIFFGNCTLRCVYCQNFQISQNHRLERTNEVTIERLAAMMLELQGEGVHSIGLVSPSHFVPQIVAALEIAARNGLRLPLVYNTNAYDAVAVLRLLEGIVDIYLPDLKYADEATAYQFSKIRKYPEIARSAIVEMHRQVGSALLLDDAGVVARGLVIRHLVLPNDLAGSRESLAWVRDTLGSDITMSIMSQYFPAHKALTLPLLDRKIRESEYERVLLLLNKLALEQGWIQEYESAECYRPDFENRDRPFDRNAVNASGDGIPILTATNHKHQEDHG
jgi:putative pyruvate formate lyase activating enzyme